MTLYFPTRHVHGNAKCPERFTSQVPFACSLFQLFWVAFRKYADPLNVIPSQGLGGLEPPTFEQLGPYLGFSSRTYPFQKTKRSQKRDFFKISDAFPAI